MIKHLLYCVAAVTLFVPAVNGAVVPFDEEHFPDPAFRAQIESMVASKKLTLEDGMLNTDKLTSFGSVNSDVTDLTGIKYFDKMTSIAIYNAAVKGLKYVDFRGMSKLSSIQFTAYGYSGDGSFQGTGNWTNNLETALIDGTAVTSIYLIGCPNFKHLSVQNCEKLTNVYVAYSNLMGLDLSTCPAVTNVRANGNHNMTHLEFSPEATGLKTVFAGDCKISKIVLPPVLTNKTFAGLSIGNNPLQHLDLGGLLDGNHTISGFYINKTQLPSVPCGSVYSGTSTWTFPTSVTINIGHVNTFHAVEPGTLGNYGSLTMTTKTGCSYDSKTGDITITDPNLKKIEYSVTCRNLSYKSYSYTVTLNRSTEPDEYYLQYTDHNPMREDWFNGGASKERVQMVYEGENTWSVNHADIPEKMLMGNFQLVRVSAADGSEEILGGNSSQVTTHHPAFEAGGYAYVGTEGKSIAVHKPQPAYKAGAFTSSRTSADYAARGAIEPWSFTTHPDELNYKANGLATGATTLKMVPGEPYGELFVEAPVVTGIEGVDVDNSMESVDEDAPVEWYNLQGMRVMNPASGQIYIRRQGNHVSKVIK